MIHTVDAGLSYLVKVSDASAVDDHLNSAVAMARQYAASKGLCGILVTKHAHDTYTVAVSEAVPFGETHERLEF
ncbi:MAG: hypothetical protein NVS2B15_11400 [Pseudarthrobacter sp.]